MDQVLVTQTMPQEVAAATLKERFFPREKKVKSTRRNGDQQPAESHETTQAPTEAAQPPRVRTAIDNRLPNNLLLFCIPKDAHKPTNHEGGGSRPDVAATVVAFSTDLPINRQRPRVVGQGAAAAAPSPPLPSSSSSSSSQSFVKLPMEYIQYFRKQGLLLSKIDQVQEREAVEQLFSNGSKEFVYSPLYACSLIDACCQQGVFPMTSSVGSGVRLFAAKLHVKRAVIRLPSAIRQDRVGGVQPGLPTTSAAAAPRAVDNCLRRLDVTLRLPGGSRRRAKHYGVVIDGCWDAVTKLINAQHGEDWLSAPLRATFKEFHDNQPGRHPKEGSGRTTDPYRTRFQCIAIVDLQKLAPLAAGDPTAVDETETTILDETGGGGEVVWRTIPDDAVVAGELGYIVGDVYTSLTGGYTESGTGALQLAVLSATLVLGGFAVWDLGMAMPYKVKELGAVELPRKQWLDLVAERRVVGVSGSGGVARSLCVSSDCAATDSSELLLTMPAVSRGCVLRCDAVMAAATSTVFSPPSTGS